MRGRLKTGMTDCALSLNTFQTGKHFQMNFYSRRASNGSISKRHETMDANLCTPLQNNILSLK